MLKAPGLSTMSEKRLNWMAFSKGSNEGEIDAIPKDKAEVIVEIIKKGIEKAQAEKSAPTVMNQQSSVADELAKLAKLKEQGALSDAEFQQMKMELIKKL